MVMRGCLENALYGLYVLHKDSGAFDRWMCRHDSDDAKRIVRNEFTIACVKKTLEDMDPKHFVVVSQLYDKTVDIGAHPNVAVSAALKTSRSEGRIQFKVLYLTADPEVMSGTLKSVAQVGGASLLIFKNVFLERFNLLGISAALEDLRRGL